MSTNYPDDRDPHRKTDAHIQRLLHETHQNQQQEMAIARMEAQEIKDRKAREDEQRKQRMMHRATIEGLEERIASLQKQQTGVNQTDVDPISGNASFDNKVMNDSKMAFGGAAEVAFQFINPHYYYEA
jgi:beta-phosphoglucomutase-like phosphatase (HAD superfamily)